ncbi:stromal interaction molecule 1-like [Temnothorax americanus]|uniref:stromal interaction molecule 1-like n=1 Tax=Temnothorax americanus TaxID=1964332 RepID=UPI0040689F69
MDVVLFGPPKDAGHNVKDLVLVTLLFGALIGCWYAYQQKKNSQKHLHRMMMDMESLHNAELALETLQTFTCPKCLKTYRHKSNFYRHRRHVHESKSFQCQYCGKIYKRHDYLKVHLRREHTEY